jgi:transcriptional regulator with XRE-family HTH domain
MCSIRHESEVVIIKQRIVLIVKDSIKIRKAIALAGYTLNAYAEKIGLSGPYLSQIISGSKLSGPIVAKRICDGLDVEVKDFFLTQPMSYSTSKTVPDGS